MNNEFTVTGVIGYPISHTVSPKMHSFWMSRYGVKGYYIPLKVKPDDLEKALQLLCVIGFKGVNITIPHKEKAAALVDEIDDISKKIGAINTIIIRENGKLEGINTDVFGFRQNLESAGFKAKEEDFALVVGAGGGARAVVSALQEMGVSNIGVFNRSKSRAEKCAKDLSVKNIEIITGGLDEIEKFIPLTSLLVNATPLGMKGQDRLDIDITKLPVTAWVTDLVYNPLETELLRKAKARGCKTVDGLGMLLHQGRKAFSCWFSIEPEVTDELRKEILVEIL